MAFCCVLMKDQDEQQPAVGAFVRPSCCCSLSRGADAWHAEECDRGRHAPASATTTTTSHCVQPHTPLALNVLAMEAFLFHPTRPPDLSFSGGPRRPSAPDKTTRPTRASLHRYSRSPVYRSTPSSPLVLDEGLSPRPPMAAIRAAAEALCSSVNGRLRGASPSLL